MQRNNSQERKVSDREDAQKISTESARVHSELERLYEIEIAKSKESETGIRRESMINGRHPRMMKYAEPERDK